MTTLTLNKLGQDIDDFLQFKRALGCNYKRGEATLRSFQRFAQQHGTVVTTKPARIDLAATIKAWLSRIEGRKSFTVSLDLGVVRQLCLHRRRRDVHGFVPEHALAPRTESVYLPYIFSREEVRQLLQAASRYHGRNSWAGMLRLLLLILYCTGLRFGEAVRLRRPDVDLDQRIFLVRESKGRTRFVPFGADLAREIEVYLVARSRIEEPMQRMTVDALFIGLDGRPISLQAASNVIRRLLRTQGMKPDSGRCGPRPYDFRHAYAVHRLTDWYRQGLDVHARLPWLSAYMGHVNVLGTEVYLHATAELLQLASERFHDRAFIRRERR